MFYLLSHAVKPGKQYLGCEPANLAPGPLDCFGCGYERVLLTMRDIDPRACRIKVLRDEPLGTIEHASSILLFRNDVRDQVLEMGLSGIEFVDPILQPIESTTSMGKLIRTRPLETRDSILHRYSVVIVTGRGALHERSGVVRLRKCPECGYETWSVPEEGAFVDESKWDETDFFFTPEYPPLFVSQKAKEVLRAFQNSNCLFIDPATITSGKIANVWLRRNVNEQNARQKQAHSS